jgi:hypothetical protein
MTEGVSYEWLSRGGHAANRQQIQFYPKPNFTPQISGGNNYLLHREPERGGFQSRGQVHTCHESREPFPGAVCCCNSPAYGEGGLVMGIEQWKTLVPKKENKISEETAREQLGKLMAYYEVELDEATPDQEAAINQIMSRIQNAFMQGKIELLENAKDDTNGLSIVQHIKPRGAVETITYKELKGIHKTKLENAGTDPTRRMHYLMGILSGLGEDVIGKLSAGDLRVCEAISGFFLVLA